MQQGRSEVRHLFLLFPMTFPIGPQHRRLLPMLSQFSKILVKVWWTYFWQPAISLFLMSSVLIICLLPWLTMHLLVAWTDPGLLIEHASACHLNWPWFGNQPFLSPFQLNWSWPVYWQCFCLLPQLTLACFVTTFLPSSWIALGLLINHVFCLLPGLIFYPATVVVGL